MQQVDRSEKQNDDCGEGQPLDSHGRDSESAEHEPRVQGAVQKESCDQYVPDGLGIALRPQASVENVLKDNNIDTCLVVGVATNVCCESTARDAMMLNYRSLMVSDGCATSTDGEHAASLGNFYLNFGDVQGTDEIIARLEASARRNTDDQAAAQ